MSVNLAPREAGNGVLIIDATGRITLGEGADSLRYTIREMARNGHKKIILNLADTSYLDSSGLGELVSGFTVLANQGASLKLLQLTPRIKDLLQLANLYTVFEVFESEEEAVESFH